MITIPTDEFIGLLSDVTPFVATDEDNGSLNCLRLRWDGEQLHAEGTDLFRIAIASWGPDAAARDKQQLPVNIFGGADNPWAIVLRLAQAQQIAGACKLPPKMEGLPLKLECYDGRLLISRPRSGRIIGIKLDVPDAGEPFNDLRAQLAEHHVIEAARGISVNQQKLADFAKVRYWDAMQLTFSGELIHVNIGTRFVGAILPANVAPRRPSLAGAGSADV